MLYVVLDESFGSPLILLGTNSALWANVPEGGILRRNICGGPVSAFTTKKAAKAAITRTLAYNASRAAKGTEAGEMLMSVSRVEIEGRAA